MVKCIKKSVFLLTIAHIREKSSIFFKKRIARLLLAEKVQAYVILKNLQFARILIPLKKYRGSFSMMDFEEADNNCFRSSMK